MWKKILITIALEYLLEWLDENGYIGDHKPMDTDIEKLATKAEQGLIGKIIDKFADEIDK